MRQDWLRRLGAARVCGQAGRMTRVRPALLVLLATGLAPGVAPRPAAAAALTEPVLIPPDLGPERMRERKAASGHAFTVDGKQVTLDGLVCPEPGTEEGRRAKALLNQFLHTNIACELVALDERTWRGSCVANGRDVAQALIGTGLCKPA